MLPLHFRAFDDVMAFLDEPDARDIPYGGVSKNVHDYQRAKFAAAGLQRTTVLAGTDTAGVTKLDPAIFLEGVRLLGAEPGQTHVRRGHVDAEGAGNAGLQGL